MASSGPTRRAVRPMTTPSSASRSTSLVRRCVIAPTSSSIVITKVQGNIVDTLMPPLSASELVLGYLAGAVGRGVMVALLRKAE